MKRELLGTLIAAACAASGTALADGYDDTGAVYISAMADYTSWTRIAFPIMPPGISRPRLQLSPNVAAELDLSPNAFRIPGTGASEKLPSLSVECSTSFCRSPR